MGGVEAEEEQGTVGSPLCAGGCCPLCAGECREVVAGEQPRAEWGWRSGVADGTCRRGVTGDLHDHIGIWDVEEEGGPAHSYRTGLEEILDRIFTFAETTISRPQHAESTMLEQRVYLRFRSGFIFDFITKIIFLRRIPATVS